MLTKRQNLLETIQGGNPDRFVNQFEPFALTFGQHPLSRVSPPHGPGDTWVNDWGVTQTFAVGTPGPMPIHDDEHILIKDITRWREVLNAPCLDFADEYWQPLEKLAATVDRKDQFLTLTMIPGILEQLHHFMGMEGAMMALALEPEATVELIDFYVEWEMAYARLQIDRIHPDALFHHDDWGSGTSTLISPTMFEEFLLPAYQKLYGFYRESGLELIIHHSDSFAATFVPYMIEMGIDIWQGVMTTNNTPELIERYGGQISFMGDIDSGIVDRADWTDELIAHEVERACRNCGKRYFIPNTIQGLPMSTFPGVYEAVSREIDRMSTLMFPQ